jgi:hypothetical protein
LVFAIPAAALLGIVLGISARKQRLRASAIAIGCVNLFFWATIALAVNSPYYKFHVREFAHRDRLPPEVLVQTVLQDVGRQLREAGATYDDLAATVAAQNNGSLLTTVTYRGLQSLIGTNGAPPASDGKIVLDYIGGGRWQGALAGKTFTVQVGSRDVIDLPFVSDPQVIGEWKSVDFVPTIADFNPDKHNWPEDKLFLKGLTFLEDGKMPERWMTWTKGMVIHHGDQTSSHYEIKEIKGRPYMFFEWKSGDVTISGMKPCYYVLKKQQTN